MARGFGATYGVTTTDIVNTSFTTGLSGQKRSYSIWVWDDGTHGGGSLGRMWDSVNDKFLIDNFGSNVYSFEVTWTSGIPAFTFAIPATGHWHNIVITYDSGNINNNAVIYVDGVSQSVTVFGRPPAVAPIITGTDHYCIGNRTAPSGTSNRYWGGKLAEWAVWDGILLTAGEASALAKGVRPSRIRGGPMPWLPLDGLQSPEPDLSGSSHNGTLTGTALQPGPPVALFTSLKGSSLIPPPVGEQMTFGPIRILPRGRQWGHTGFVQ